MKYAILILLMLPVVTFSGESSARKDFQIGKVNHDIIKKDLNSDLNSTYQDTDRLILYTPLEGYEKKIRVPASVVPAQFEGKSQPGKLLEW